MKKIVFSLLMSPLAVAQVVDGQSQQIRQQQQFEQQQWQAQQRWLSQHQYQAVTNEPELADLSQQCLPFERVDFIGVSLIDVTPFAPKPRECLNEVRLNQLSRDLTAAYLAEGYIHNPFRFENDGTGVLRVKVTEGRVRSLKTESKRLHLATLFPNLVGQPLNVKQLDQGLDQAHRMTKVNASVDVLPTAEGEIDLVFVNQDQSPFSGAIGLDNRATKAYGQWQLRAEANWDSALGLSDSLFVTASSTLKAARRDFSRSVSLFHRIPYGNWSFSTFAALSKSNLSLKLPTLTAEQRSQTKQIALKADYMVHRGTNHISTLSGQLERIDSQSYFNESLLTIQSPKLTVAQFQLNHLQLFSQGSLGFNLSYEKGLHWWKAMSNQGRDQPEGQFNKWNLSLQLQHFHRWNDQLFLFEHLLSGQYSQNYLPGLKQAELLGDYAVRGFKEFSSVAEQQLLLRNRFAWLYQQNQWRTEPYVALDLGLQKTSTGEAVTRKASGYGAGIRLHHSWLNSELSYMQGHLHSNAQQPSQNERNWLFSINVPF